MFYETWWTNKVLGIDKDLTTSLLRALNATLADKVDDAIFLRPKVVSAIELLPLNYGIPKLRIRYAHISYGNRSAFILQTNGEWVIKQPGGFLGHDLYDITNVLRAEQKLYDDAYNNFVQFYTKSYMSVLDSNGFLENVLNLLSLKNGLHGIADNVLRVFESVDGIFLDLIKDYTHWMPWSDPVIPETFYPINEWIPLQIDNIWIAGKQYRPRMINENDVFHYYGDNQFVNELCEAITNTFEFIKYTFLGETEYARNFYNLRNA